MSQGSYGSYVSVASQPPMGGGGLTLAWGLQVGGGDNDIHGYSRARIEHLFASLWSWRVVGGIWLGSHVYFCFLYHVHMYFPKGGWTRGRAQKKSR